MKIYIHTTPAQGRPKPLQKLRQLPFFIAVLCSFSQLPITHPCGLTLAQTPIRTARHRSASRGTHCCDNCVRTLSSCLPHRAVKIRCFFDADSPALNYTRHSCSTALDAGHITKLITRDRVSDTEAKQSTQLVENTLGGTKNVFNYRRKAQCSDLMVCMVSLAWVLLR